MFTNQIYSLKHLEHRKIYELLIWTQSKDVHYSGPLKLISFNSYEIDLEQIKINYLYLVEKIAKNIKLNELFEYAIRWTINKWWASNGKMLLFVSEYGNEQRIKKKLVVASIANICLFLLFCLMCALFDTLCFLDRNLFVFFLSSVIMAIEQIIIIMVGKNE